jgi:chromate reductase
MKIIAISGSLRKNSYNTGLIRSAIELKQESLDIEYFDIKDIPLYNADIDGQDKPKAVLELAKKVEEADGILISVPEYNYSFTAALKNAFDWLSRMTPMPLLGKPLAMMGASYGMSGSMRAQLHKFDAEGNLTDEPTKQYIKKMLISFEKFIADNKH